MPQEDSSHYSGLILFAHGATRCCFPIGSRIPALVFVPIPQPSVHFCHKRSCAQSISEQYAFCLSHFSRSRHAVSTLVCCWSFRYNLPRTLCDVLLLFSRWAWLWISFGSANSWVRPNCTTSPGPLLVHHILACVALHSQDALHEVAICFVPAICP